MVRKVGQSVRVEEPSARAAEARAAHAERVKYRRLRARGCSPRHAFHRTVGRPWQWGKSQEG